MQRFGSTILLIGFLILIVFIVRKCEERSIKRQAKKEQREEINRETTRIIKEIDSDRKKRAEKSTLKFKKRDQEILELTELEFDSQLNLIFESWEK